MMRAAGGDDAGDPGHAARLAWREQKGNIGPVTGFVKLLVRL